MKYGNAAAWVLAVHVVTAMTACAQLQWANMEQSIDAKPGDAKIIVDYAFTNVGAYAVTIESVKTSCGCTTAELEKKHYEPGEGGVIGVKFDVGSRIGLQTKRILVKTDDAKNPEATLELKVNIPRLLVIEPQLVSWETGEAVETRIVRMVAPEGSSVKITSAKPSSAEVEAVVKTVREGLEYTLAITPLSTATNFNGVVLIQASSADGAVKEFRVYYRTLPRAERKSDP